MEEKPIETVQDWSACFSLTILYVIFTKRKKCIKIFFTIHNDSNYIYIVDLVSFVNNIYIFRKQSILSKQWTYGLDEEVIKRLNSIFIILYLFRHTSWTLKNRSISFILFIYVPATSGVHLWEKAEEVFQLKYFAAQLNFSHDTSLCCGAAVENLCYIYSANAEYAVFLSDKQACGFPPHYWLNARFKFNFHKNKNCLKFKKSLFRYSLAF